jgi:cytochrome c oxidase subunit II
LLEKEVVMFKRSVFIIASLAVAAFGMAACAPPENGIPDTGEEELVRMGEQVYADRCAGCHLPDGLGEPPLDANPFVTGDPHPVIAIVLHGNGDMPAFGERLTDEEVAGVVTYIRNAWTNNASTVTISDVQAAR